VLQPVDVLVVAFSSTAFKRVVRVLELAPSSTS